MLIHATCAAYRARHSHLSDQLKYLRENLELTKFMVQHSTANWTNALLVGMWLTMLEMFHVSVHILTFLTNEYLHHTVSIFWYTLWYCIFCRSAYSMWFSIPCMLVLCHIYNLALCSFYYFPVSRLPVAKSSAELLFELFAGLPFRGKVIKLVNPVLQKNVIILHVLQQ